MFNLKLFTYVADPSTGSHFLRVGKARGPKELHRNRCGIFITVALASANLLANVAQADSLIVEARIPNPSAELPLLILTPQAAPVNLMNRLIAPTTRNSSSAKLSRLNDTSLLARRKFSLLRLRLGTPVCCWPAGGGSGLPSLADHQ